MRSTIEVGSTLSRPRRPNRAYRPARCGDRSAAPACGSPQGREARRVGARTAVGDEAAEGVVDLGGAVGDGIALQRFGGRVEASLRAFFARDDGDVLTGVEGVATDARTDDEDRVAAVCRTFYCVLGRNLAASAWFAVSGHFALSGNWRRLARIAARVHRVRGLCESRRGSNKGTQRCCECEQRQSAHLQFPISGKNDAGWITSSIGRERGQCDSLYHFGNL